MKFRTTSNTRSHLTGSSVNDERKSRRYKLLCPNRMLDGSDSVATMENSLQNNKIINIQQAGKLATDYYNAEKYDKAERICRIILKKQPNCPEALHLKGRIALSNGDYHQAKHLFELAVKEDSFKDYFYCYLGIAYKMINRFYDAVAAFETAIELNPLNLNAFYNKGLTYKTMSDPGRAAEAFQRAVTIDPDHQSARHQLAALTGEDTDAAPQQYIIDLFNQYSRSFDEHLLYTLEYRLPEIIHSELNAFCKPRFKNAIDLGCGTGLVGNEIRNLADQLIGVDLSLKMATLAWNKHIYDMVFEHEMVDFLNQTTMKYDLFIAADSLVYTGNLTPLFEALKNKSANDAFFIFTTERTEGKPFQLLQTGRYAHSPDYIKALSDEFGYTVEVSRQCINVRREMGSWVIGDLFVLKL